VADLAEELHRKNRNPLHLVIDEADAFAPQKPRPDETRMLGALDEIVRRGRIRGLGCTLVTQRWCAAARRPERSASRSRRGTAPPAV